MAICRSKGFNCANNESNIRISQVHHALAFSLNPNFDRFLESLVPRIRLSQRYLGFHIARPLLIVMILSADLLSIF
jgi:hypothetical protein